MTICKLGVAFCSLCIALTQMTLPALAQAPTRSSRPTDSHGRTQPALLDSQAPGASRLLAPPPAGSSSRSRATRKKRRRRDAPRVTVDVAALLARVRRDEPALVEVRAAALRAAGLDGRAERRLARRARRAGSLPQLSLRASLGAGNDRDLSHSSTGSERLDIGSDRDVDLELKATWQLDRLIFDDVELRILQSRQRTFRARVQLLSQVTSVYYQRRKLQLAPPAASDIDKSALHALALAELTGQLDALTAGYFSAACARRRAENATR